MQTLLAFFEEIRKNSDKYATKIEKMLTSTESLNREKLLEFVLQF